MIVTYENGEKESLCHVGQSKNTGELVAVKGEQAPDHPAEMTINVNGLQIRTSRFVCCDTLDSFTLCEQETVNRISRAVTGRQPDGVAVLRATVMEDFGQWSLLVETATPESCHQISETNATIVWKLRQGKDHACIASEMGISIPVLHRKIERLLSDRGTVGAISYPLDSVLLS